MLHYMLVVSDSVEGAECSLEYIINIAPLTQSKVTFLCQLAPHPDRSTNQLVDPLDWHLYRIEAETSLNQLVNQLRGMEIEAQTAIIESSAVEQLIEVAEEYQADLFVIGKQADTTNSLFHALVKASPIPILSLPVSQSQLGHVPAQHPQDSSLPQTILVPLDGSQRAECSLPLASFLTQMCEAQLILAHVVHKPEMPRRGPLSLEDMELSHQIVESNRTEVAQYLDETASRLPHDVQIRVIVGDNAATTIHQLIETDHVDLMVLSAHGYGADPRWPCGNIARNLIDYSPKPVLIVQDLPAVRTESLEKQAVASRRSVR